METQGTEYQYLRSMNTSWSTTHDGSAAQTHESDNAMENVRIMPPVRHSDSLFSANSTSETLMDMASEKNTFMNSDIVGVLDAVPPHEVDNPSADDVTSAMAAWQNESLGITPLDGIFDGAEISCRFDERAVFGTPLSDELGAQASENLLSVLAMPHNHEPYHLSPCADETSKASFPLMEIWLSNDMVDGSLSNVLEMVHIEMLSIIDVYQDNDQQTMCQSSSESLVVKSDTCQFSHLLE